MYAFFDKNFNSETMYNKKISKSKKEIGHKKKESFNVYILSYHHIEFTTKKNWPFRKLITGRI